MLVLMKYVPDDTIPVIQSGPVVCCLKVPNFIPFLKIVFIKSMSHPELDPASWSSISVFVNPVLFWAPPHKAQKDLFADKTVTISANKINVVVVADDICVLIFFFVKKF